MRMLFVDRQIEIKRLKGLLSSSEPSFVIVRGRRRIGKSALIGRVLSDNDIYFEADRTDAIEQIRICAQVISARFPGFADAEYKDWRALLTALNYRVTDRIVLCLDEFPYLVENTPALPSVIQSLLDKGDLKYHLIL